MHQSGTWPMRVRVPSFSCMVFIRYREFNPRFVHSVHEILNFFRVHGSTKRRKRPHAEKRTPCAYFLNPTLKGHRLKPSLSQWFHQGSPR